MKASNRIRRNGSAKPVAQQAQTAARANGHRANKPTGGDDKFDLVQDPPESGIFFLESLSGQRTRITLAQARDFYLRNAVPKALRPLIGRAGDLTALENVVLESYGLFAMIEGLVNEYVPPCYEKENKRGEQIVAGVCLMTDGFRERLAAAFDSFYPDSTCCYARKEQGV